LLRKKQSNSVGALEAEAELSNRSTIKLADVFYDLIDIEDFFETSNRFILVGGKGSGKTAFARMHQAQTKNKYNKFTKIISKGEYDLERVIQDLQMSEDSEEKNHKELFDWLIINQLIEMMQQHELIKTFKKSDLLEEYKETNRGIVGISEREFVEAFKQFNGSVKVTALDNFITANFGKSNKFKYKKAEFTKVLPDLKRVARLILSELSDRIPDEDLYFTIVFDDLDQNLKNIKEHRDMLMNMIRVAKDYNLFFSEQENIIVKIALLVRPDILSELDDYTDSFKVIESYKRQIEWFLEEEYYNGKTMTSLRKMVNLRIMNAVQPKRGAKKIHDAWSEIINDSTFPQQFKKPSSFKWCLDRTRYRPRDIIDFINVILKHKKQGQKITYQAIQKSLPKYSSNLWKEIKNELSFYFELDEMNVIENALKNMDDHFRTNQFTTAIEGKTKYEPGRVLEILFNASVLGNMENGIYYYKHRETSDNLIKHDLGKDFCVNIGLKNVFM